MMTEHQRDTLGALRLALKSTERAPSPADAPQDTVQSVLHPAKVAGHLLPHWANIEALQGIPDAKDSAPVILVLARLLKHMPNNAPELRVILMTLADYSPGANKQQEDMRYQIDTFEDIPLLLLKFFEIRGIHNILERQWTVEAIRHTRDEKAIVKANMLIATSDKNNPPKLGTTKTFVGPGQIAGAAPALIQPGVTYMIHVPAMGTAGAGNGLINLPSSVIAAATMAAPAVAYPNGGSYNPLVGSGAASTGDEALIQMSPDFEQLVRTITNNVRKSYGFPSHQSK